MRMNTAKHKKKTKRETKLRKEKNYSREEQSVKPQHQDQ